MATARPIDIVLDLTCIHSYTADMGIIWDQEKAKQNVRKHGVRFADAVLVLDDPYTITISDYESEPAEARWGDAGR